MKTKKTLAMLFLLFLLSNQNYSILLSNEKNLIDLNKKSFLEKNNLSNESDVVAAIRNKAKMNLMKFYDIQDWMNIAQLNQKVLPIFKKMIDKDGLVLDGNDLFYDIEKLSIVASKEFKADKLIVTMKYFQREFDIELLFDKNFNDDDFIQAIKSWFENSNNKNLDLFDWDTNTDINKKTIDWVKQLLATQSIKINNEKINIDINKFFINGIDSKNLLDGTIKLLANYNNSDFEDLSIKINIEINSQKLIDELKTNLNQNLVLLLNKDINNYNFIEKAPFAEWIKVIREFIGSKVIIDNKEVEINSSKISFQMDKITEKNLNLSPWSNSVSLPITYELLNQKYFFNVEIQLRFERNDQELINQFKKTLLEKIEFIDGTTIHKYASKQDFFPIILSNLKKNAPFKIVIPSKQKEFDYNLTNLDIIDYEIKYTDNNFSIDLTLKDKLISSENIVINLPLKNYIVELAFNKIDETINHGIASIHQNNVVRIDQAEWEFKTQAELHQLVIERIKNFFNDVKEKEIKETIDLILSKSVIIGTISDAKILLKYNDFISKNSKYAYLIMNNLNFNAVNDKIKFALHNNFTTQQMLKLDFSKTDVEIKQQILAILLEDVNNVLEFDSNGKKYQLNLNDLEILTYVVKNDQIELKIRHPRIGIPFTFAVNIPNLTENDIINYLENVYFDTIPKIAADRWLLNDLLFNNTIANQNKIINLIFEQIHLPKFLMSVHKYWEPKISDFSWYSYEENNENEITFIFKSEFFIKNNIKLIKIKVNLENKEVKLC